MKNTSNHYLLCLSTAAFFLPAFALHAQLATWQNTGTDWNTGTNWSPSVVPGSGDAAIFSAAVTQNPNLSASASILRVTTSTSSTNTGSFTLSSSATNIALTLITTQTGNSSALFYNDNTGGTWTISAPLILGSAADTSQTVNVVNSGATVEISGVISSATNVGLTKAGAGALNLSGLNTYGGPTTIGEGVIRVTNLADAGLASAIGTNQRIVITNNGRLNYAGTTNSSMNRTLNLAAGQADLRVSNALVSLTLSGVISNTGSLFKGGAGTLILTGTNTYTGGTTVSLGTLQGSTLSLQGNITNNAVVLFSNTVVGTNSSVISGNGSLVKAGGSTVTLGASNSYTGGTTIVTESLAAGANGAFGTGRLNFSNSGTARLNLNGFTNTITGLTLSGAGAKAIQNEGTNAASAGRLIIDIASGTESSDATTQIRNGSSLAAGFGALALTKTGAGTLDLSVINSSPIYSGGLTVNAGTLGFGAATNAVGSGVITLGGGTLRYTATGSTNGTLANAFSLTPATSSTVDVSASTLALNLSNVISGSGALLKAGAGTLVLSGTNTYTGNTTINAGTFTLATNGSLRFVIGGSGTNNALGGTATAQLNGTIGFDLSSAATNTNATWTIVPNTLSTTYGTNFLVTGFSGAGGNWTNTTNGVNYVFAQSSGVLSVQSTGGVTPYNAWVAYWQTNSAGFTNTAGTANPDGDPFDNNKEFAFDGNPTIGTGTLLTATKVGTNAVFNYVALTNTNAATYAVQFTTNLTAGWTNASVTISNSTNQSGISQTNNYLRKEFVVPATTNNFYRVQAAIAP